jgi:hypothetical protein
LLCQLTGFHQVQSGKPFYLEVKAKAMHASEVQPLRISFMILDERPKLSKLAGRNKPTGRQDVEDVDRGDHDREFLFMDGRDSSSYLFKDDRGPVNSVSLGTKEDDGIKVGSGEQVTCRLKLFGKRNKSDDAYPSLEPGDSFVVRVTASQDHAYSCAQSEIRIRVEGRAEGQKGPSTRKGVLNRVCAPEVVPQSAAPWTTRKQEHVKKALLGAIIKNGGWDSSDERVTENIVALALEELGHNPTAADLEPAVKKLKVKMDELKNVSLEDVNRVASAARLFHGLDTKKDGNIDLKGLKNELKKDGAKKATLCDLFHFGSDGEIATFFFEADTDGDMRLSFKEFMSKLEVDAVIAETFWDWYKESVFKISMAADLFQRINKHSLKKRDELLIDYKLLQRDQGAICWLERAVYVGSRALGYSFSSTTPDDSSGASSQYILDLGSLVAIKSFKFKSCRRSSTFPVSEAQVKVSCDKWKWRLACKGNWQKEVKNLARGLVRYVKISSDTGGAIDTNSLQNFEVHGAEATGHLPTGSTTSGHGISPPFELEKYYAVVLDSRSDQTVSILGKHLKWRKHA